MTLGISPMRYVDDDAHDLAVVSLRGYFASEIYTGAWFEEMIDSSSPFEITAKDIVAVTALGVDIPVRASHWMLDEGRDEISEHLSAIEPEAKIWGETDLSPTGNAWLLWNRLSEIHGLGATKTSKLLSAKRPHLLPIWDQHVVTGLRPAKGDYWLGWRDSLASDSGELLRQTCETLREEASVPESVSLLRILDVVIWMRVHGHKWLPESDQEQYRAAPEVWIK